MISAFAKAGFAFNNDAYVCKQGICKLPVTSLGDFEMRLRE